MLLGMLFMNLAGLLYGMTPFCHLYFAFKQYILSKKMTIMIAVAAMWMAGMIVLALLLLKETLRRLRNVGDDRHCSPRISGGFGSGAGRRRDSQAYGSKQ